MFFVPEIFWNVPPKILDRHYKIGPITDHRAKFHAGWPMHLGDCASGEKKLEIWGKAQRESARRPKCDWGKLGGQNFPGIKITWPELECIGIGRTRIIDLG